jgi:hypothetical protein
MAFTVRKIKHRPWPVTIIQQLAAGDGSVAEVSSTFMVRWKPFTEKQLKEIHDELDKRFPPPEEGKVAPMDQALERAAAFYPQLVCGWGDEVKDEDGIPLPYTEQTLADMITGPDGAAISAGLGAALMQIRFGVAPAKNSPTSPEPGQASAPGEVETNSQKT